MDTFASDPSARPADYAMGESYQRNTYDGLFRHEVIAPAVTNDGKPSGYPDALGIALIEAGFNWTAINTVGAWNGKIEPGRQFTIFAPEFQYPVEDGETVLRLTAGVIGQIARDLMTDQEAIQVVVDCPVRLIEA